MGWSHIAVLNARTLTLDSTLAWSYRHLQHPLWMRLVISTIMSLPNIPYSKYFIPFCSYPILYSIRLTPYLYVKFNLCNPSTLLVLFSISSSLSLLLPHNVPPLFHSANPFLTPSSPQPPQSIATIPLQSLLDMLHSRPVHSPPSPLPSFSATLKSNSDLMSCVIFAFRSHA